MCISPVHVSIVQSNQHIMCRPAFSQSPQAQFGECFLDSNPYKMQAFLPGKFLTQQTLKEVMGKKFLCHVETVSNSIGGRPPKG